MLKLRRFAPLLHKSKLQDVLVIFCCTKIKRMFNDENNNDILRVDFIQQVFETAQRG